MLNALKELKFKYKRNKEHKDVRSTKKLQKSLVLYIILVQDRINNNNNNNNNTAPAQPWTHFSNLSRCTDDSPQIFLFSSTDFETVKLPGYSCSESYTLP
jgi:hypothetical protein